VAELGKFLRFLKAQEERSRRYGKIGIVDDHSPLMDEVLNMLARRNLLYRVVPAPDRKLDITVQLGTKDFPKESAENPSDFAARVRAKLGDDKRLVRLYGATTIIAHLTGDGKRARLFLLNYGRGRGRWRGGADKAFNSRARALSTSNFAAAGGGGCRGDRCRKSGNTTEFSLLSDISHRRPDAVKGEVGRRKRLPRKQPPGITVTLDNPRHPAVHGIWNFRPCTGFADLCRRRPGYED
jgi:hypothetical protein